MSVAPPLENKQWKRPCLLSATIRHLVVIQSEKKNNCGMAMPSCKSLRQADTGQALASTTHAARRLFLDFPRVHIPRFGHQKMCKCTQREVVREPRNS